MEKDVYMSISRRAKALLQRQEGLDVEFKQTVKGVEATDLVAFANSAKGGAILVGVSESEEEGSMQKGKIIGCPVGDKEKLYILSKSESCVPPVEVNIIIENYARKPFFRIEIPSGKEKPYCTAGGTYKIRGDGRTNILLPGRLLSLFIEKQSEIFFNRFREATKELGKNMLNSNSALQEEMQDLLKKILNMEYTVETRLEDIQEGVDYAEAISTETACYFDSLFVSFTKLKERISYLEKGLADIERKLDLILERTQATYPLAFRELKQPDS
ncbi:MAG TPA: ATP-binding protein [Peptococcaceae bacterium]|nr:ATP-binding protein [Peptococcaceae bacterium]